MINFAFTFMPEHTFCPARSLLIMINRALIRTRALQVLYAYHHRDDLDLKRGEEELTISLSKTYDLYLHFLNLIPELTHLHCELLEQRKKRLLPTEEDLKPNMRLAENRLAKVIDNSVLLAEWAENSGLSWWENRELMRLLLDKIMTSELYLNYRNAEATGFMADRTFWAEAFKTLIANDDDLAEYLESKSIYWYSELNCLEKIECEEMPEWEAIETQIDQAKNEGNYQGVPNAGGAVQIVKDFVEKTIKRITSKTADKALMPMFRDEEDRTFARTLVHMTLLEHDRWQKLIRAHLSDSWEAERVADVDMLIMEMAVCEMVHCPDIATGVTINEYIELAKSYSTPKSHPFINGVLDAVAQELKQTGTILKV